MHATTKAALAGGISSIAVICALAPMSAYAQAEGAAAVEEVVVTGSRIRNGFQTPTPVTTSTTDDLKAAAPGNLADGLNQLPVFNGSTKTSQATGGGLAGGTLGQNILNLRGLGGNRALVLLDGTRMVATNETGSVDINVLPQNLVSRVDVVTGGASAAYGSDAVAGVINFVLDTRFEGIKGEIEGGISKYKDSQSFMANIAVGHQFADGKLRVIGSAEFSRQGGVGITDKSGRAWWDDAAGQVPNPTTGAQPLVLVVPSLKAALGSNGGLISSGPLRGTQFIANGQSAPFQYGSVVSNTYMSGGDVNAGNPGNSLSPDQKRSTAFARAEFDLTPDTMVYSMPARTCRTRRR
jgi:iron complex outermembrane receptor protein